MFYDRVFQIHNNTCGRTFLCKYVWRNVTFDQSYLVVVRLIVVVVTLIVVEVVLVGGVRSSGDHILVVVVLLFFFCCCYSYFCCCCFCCCCCCLIYNIYLSEITKSVPRIFDYYSQCVENSTIVSTTARYIFLFLALSNGVNTNLETNTVREQIKKWVRLQ